MATLSRFEDIQGIGQIKGPVPNKDAGGNKINLISLFDTQYKGYITKLSIYAPEGAILFINNKEFHIGKTEFLEYESGAKIYSLAFESEITDKFMIDFIYVVQDIKGDK